MCFTGLFGHVFLFIHLLHTTVFPSVTRLDLTTPSLLFPANRIDAALFFLLYPRETLSKV